ncbi:response regulator [Pseudomonas aeruginosa]|nr:response regulator [Pseudomonas aeruginosa]
MNRRLPGTLLIALCDQPAPNRRGHAAPAQAGRTVRTLQRSLPDNPTGRTMVNGENKIVLVLEEHAEQLWRIEEFLLDRGYAVLSAASRDEALDHLASDAVIDLFLLSEQLEGPLSGSMLIETSLPVRPRMRVILLSDSARVGIDPAAPYPVLLKPVTLEELGKAIDLVLHSAPVCPGV